MKMFAKQRHCTHYTVCTHIALSNLFDVIHSVACCCFVCYHVFLSHLQFKQNTVESKFIHDVRSSDSQKVRSFIGIWRCDIRNMRLTMSRCGICDPIWILEIICNMLNMWQTQLQLSRQSSHSRQHTMSCYTPRPPWGSPGSTGCQNVQVFQEL